MPPEQYVRGPTPSGQGFDRLRARGECPRLTRRRIPPVSSLLHLSLVNAASLRSYCPHRGQSPPIPVSLGRLRWSLPLFFEGACPPCPASSRVRSSARPRLSRPSDPFYPVAVACLVLRNERVLDSDSPAAVPFRVALFVQMPASPVSYTLIHPPEATCRAATARGLS